MKQCNHAEHYLDSFEGPYWIRINVKGKAAHGSMPEAGDNAIDGACIVINELKKILPDTKHKILGKSTLNVGMIKGGVKINVVPDECYVDCDFRLIPEDKHEEQTIRHNQSEHGGGKY